MKKGVMLNFIISSYIEKLHLEIFFSFLLRCFKHRSYHVNTEIVQKIYMKYTNFSIILFEAHTKTQDTV